MPPQDMPYADADIKHPSTSSRPKFWSPLYHDVFDHEVVGPNVKTPKPANPKRTAWQPFTVWFWMLSETAHRSRMRVIKGRTIHLDRGQVAVSERYLAEKANWSRRAVTTFLERLAKFDMVTLSGATRDGQLALDFSRQKTAPVNAPVITVVTICNYDKYQFDALHKRASQRASMAPATRQNLTSETPIVDTDSSQSPKGGVKGEEVNQPDAAGTDADERLPFSTTALEEIAGLDGMDEADIGLLIARYRKVAHKKAAKGQPIEDPSKYLVSMAYDEAAKKRGITVEQLKRLISHNAKERVTEMANVVGAFSKPSPAVLERHMRYNAKRVEQALNRMVGKSFSSQAAADKAFEEQITVARFSRSAA